MRVNTSSFGKVALAAFIIFLAFAPFAHAAGPKVASFNGPGYSIEIPQDWRHQQRGTLAVRFESGSPADGMVLDVFTQPLAGKTPREYINYSNRYVFQGVASLTVLSHRFRDSSPVRGRGWTRSCRSCDIEEIEWLRPAVSPDDQNYYREINLIRRGIVYTFLCKVRQSERERCGAEVDAVVRSLTVTPLVASSNLSTTFSAKAWGQASVSTGLAQEPGMSTIDMLFEKARRSGGGNLHVSIPDDGLLWGIFDGYAPFDFKPLEEKEHRLGSRFGLVMTYRDFSAPFPYREVLNAAKQGRLTMITWQPWYLNRLTDPVLIPEIVAGKHDTYIRTWASLIRDLREPVLLRFANEMNGDWDPWSVYFYGFDHDLFIKAWRRIHDIFQSEGATNAIWVWNPHDRSYPSFTWNDPHLYYPGDKYVDIVGLTGYNTGPRAGDPWRGFDEIYGGLYADYLNRYPAKPMMITEFASDEYGGDKAAWIRDAFQAIRRYPAIRMAVWFDFPWWKWDYRIASSPAAEKAFAESLDDHYFQRATVRWMDGDVVSGP